jgi:hypothetical protein
MLSGTDRLGLLLGTDAGGLLLVGYIYIFFDTCGDTKAARALARIPGNWDTCEDTRATGARAGIPGNWGTREDTGQVLMLLEAFTQQQPGNHYELHVTGGC